MDRQGHKQFVSGGSVLRGSWASSGELLTSPLANCSCNLCFVLFCFPGGLKDSIILLRKRSIRAQIWQVKYPTEIVMERTIATCQPDR